jgi:hypothetical protein
MFRMRGRERSETSASSGLRPRLAKRRSLVVKVNRAEGHHRIEGIKMMKDCGIVMDTSEVSVSEACEEGIRVVLSFIGHANNCKL